MKVCLHFKTPDVADYALQDLSEEEQEKAQKVIEKFVKYGENLTVEVDTDTGTAVVVPVSGTMASTA